MARAVLHIDHFSGAIAKDLQRSKVGLIRELARDLSMRAEAIRLGIAMELPGERLLAPCDDFRETARQLQRVSSKSRLPEASKLALQLVIRLEEQVRLDLQQWNSHT